MSARTFTESIVEQAALTWLEDVGWEVRNGAEIAPGEPAAERDGYGQVFLTQCPHELPLPLVSCDLRLNGVDKFAGRAT